MACTLIRHWALDITLKKRAKIEKTLLAPHSVFNPGA